MPADPPAMSVAPTAAFTRERVERVMTVSVGIGCVVLGGQALVGSFGAASSVGGWNLLFQLVTFTPLTIMLVAFVFGRAEKLSACVFIGAYMLVLLLWPLASGHSADAASAQPWVYFLVNVATTPAALLLRPALQVVFTVGLPLLYGVVRWLELDRDPAAVWPTLLDVSFALILGGVLLALGWTFRAAASVVDEQRAVAVRSHAHAAALSASERERVAVAALMHDSVLAALIAAGRADSERERDLAVSMAREALTRLANADRDVGEGSDAPVPAQAVVRGVSEALVGTGVHVRADIHPDTPELPGRAARAVVLAANQAISNAVRHADAAGLDVSVTGLAQPAGVRVRISDTGSGFDLDAVPADRLGIRGSIRARMSAFGGRTVIHSGAAGTVVLLEWLEADA